jgi:hypothetical protein
MSGASVMRTPRDWWEGEDSNLRSYAGDFTGRPDTVSLFVLNSSRQRFRWSPFECGDLDVRARTRSAAVTGGTVRQAQAPELLLRTL